MHARKCNPGKVGDQTKKEKERGKKMRLNVTFDALVYKKKETPYELKDGTKGVSRKLLLDQNDSVGEFKVTEDLFKDIIVGANCRFAASYDTEKGYFTISGAKPLGNAGK